MAKNSHLGLKILSQKSVQLRWLFQDLGFVEALPDVSSTNNQSRVFLLKSTCLKIWPLKKIKEWGEASTFKNKRTKSHSCSFNYQPSCFPSFLPTRPPLPSSSLPNYVLVMSRAQDCYLPLESGDRSICELEIRGGKRRNLNLYSIVQDYFQLFFRIMSYPFIFSKKQFWVGDIT